MPFLPIHSTSISAGLVKTTGLRQRAVPRDRLCQPGQSCARRMAISLQPAHWLSLALWCPCLNSIASFHRRCGRWPLNQPRGFSKACATQLPQSQINVVALKLKLGPTGPSLAGWIFGPDLHWSEASVELDCCCLPGTQDLGWTAPAVDMD